MADSIFRILQSHSIQFIILYTERMLHLHFRLRAIEAAVLFIVPVFIGWMCTCAVVYLFIHPSICAVIE